LWLGSSPSEIDLRESGNEPNADGFSGYLAMFEDTSQVINEISHGSRAFDVTGVA
jgi:hypothetical protein